MVFLKCTYYRYQAIAAVLQRKLDRARLHSLRQETKQTRRQQSTNLRQRGVANGFLKPLGLGKFSSDLEILETFVLSLGILFQISCIFLYVSVSDFCAHLLGLGFSHYTRVSASRRVSDFTVRYSSSATNAILQSALCVPTAHSLIALVIHTLYRNHTQVGFLLHRMAPAGLVAQSKVSTFSKREVQSTIHKYKDCARTFTYAAWCFQIAFHVFFQNSCSRLVS